MSEIGASGDSGVDWWVSEIGVWVNAVFGISSSGIDAKAALGVLALAVAVVWVSAIVLTLGSAPVVETGYSWVSDIEGAAASGDLVTEDVGVSGIVPLVAAVIVDGLGTDSGEGSAPLLGLGSGLGLGDTSPGRSVADEGVRFCGWADGAGLFFISEMGHLTVQPNLRQERWIILQSTAVTDPSIRSFWSVPCQAILSWNSRAVCIRSCP